MIFNPPLIKAKLIKRYKRFLADVAHPELGEFTVHCPNTGSMKNCWQAGWNVWLQKSDNLKRKYPYTWVLAENELGEMIGINTHLANKIVVEALQDNKIAEIGDEISAIKNIQTEVKYGSENSRVDFVVTDFNGIKTFVEVKSVTLKNEIAQSEEFIEGLVGLGSFPDAKTVRGQKHLRELTEIAEQGKDKAVLFFLVQHTGIKSMNIASEIDPEYAKLCDIAMKKGVQILVFSTSINNNEIVIDQAIPFKLRSAK